MFSIFSPVTFVHVLLVEFSLESGFKSERSTSTNQVQYNRDFTYYLVSIIMPYAKTNTQIALLISALVLLCTGKILSS